MIGNDESSRVFRGGCWSDQRTYTRVTLCSGSAPGYNNSIVGVRLVRVVSPLEQLVEKNET